MCMEKHKGYKILKLNEKILAYLVTGLLVLGIAACSTSSSRVNNESPSQSVTEAAKLTEVEPNQVVPQIVLGLKPRTGFTTSDADSLFESALINNGIIDNPFWGSLVMTRKDAQDPKNLIAATFSILEQYVSASTDDPNKIVIPINTTNGYSSVRTVVNLDDEITSVYIDIVPNPKTLSSLINESVQARYNEESVSKKNVIAIISPIGLIGCRYSELSFDATASIPPSLIGHRADIKLSPSDVTDPILQQFLLSRGATSISLYLKKGYSFSDNTYIGLEITKESFFSMEKTFKYNLETNDLTLELGAENIPFNVVVTGSQAEMMLIEDRKYEQAKLGANPGGLINPLDNKNSNLPYNLGLLAKIANANPNSLIVVAVKEGADYRAELVSLKKNDEWPVNIFTVGMTYEYENPKNWNRGNDFYMFRDLKKGIMNVEDAALFIQSYAADLIRDNPDLEIVEIIEILKRHLGIN